MNEANVVIADAAVRALILATLPAGALRSNVLVTDRVEAAISSPHHVAFVGSSLRDIITVVHASKAAGVLRPSHVNAATVEAIAAGCRVYSRYRAVDLSMPEAHWLIVQMAAAGYAHGATAEQVGYSVRQVRRLLASYTPSHESVTRFSWRLLAPLIRHDAGEPS